MTNLQKTEDSSVKVTVQEILDDPEVKALMERTSYVSTIREVCMECGVSANVLACLYKHGNTPKKLKCDSSTYHKGVCDFCGEEKGVTQVRDFFSPDFWLLKRVMELHKKYF